MTRDRQMTRVIFPGRPIWHKVRLRDLYYWAGGRKVADDSSTMTFPMIMTTD